MSWKLITALLFTSTVVHADPAPKSYSFTIGDPLPNGYGIDWPKPGPLNMFYHSVDQRPHNTTVIIGTRKFVISNAKDTSIHVENKVVKSITVFAFQEPLPQREALDQVRMVWMHSQIEPSKKEAALIEDFINNKSPISEFRLKQLELDAKAETYIEFELRRNYSMRAVSSKVPLYAFSITFGGR